uniref:Uncharacterized protein n=1 Tax=Chenopodium quinoa TaxID=63459 RepID=A0A803MQW1_CHEQI
MFKQGRERVPMKVMGLLLGEFVDEYAVMVVDVFSMLQSGTGVSGLFACCQPFFHSDPTSFVDVGGGVFRFDDNPYKVNIILAGFDQDTGPSLYFIDYIATLHKVDKAAFGYGSYFALSMMDRHYRSDMSVDEAIKLVDDCIVEIRTRLVVAPPNFVIKIVDKDGACEFAWRESIKDQVVADANANAAAISASA